MIRWENIIHFMRICEQRGVNCPVALPINIIKMLREFYGILLIVVSINTLNSSE